LFSSLNRAAFVASASVLALIGLCGGTGLWSALRMSDALTDSERASGLQRHHLTADMMHDAIRSDVLAAMMARDPASGLLVADARNDLQEHMQTFRGEIEGELSIASSDAEREALQSVLPDLESYVASAQRIVDAAETDPTGALGQLPGFFAEFTVLEESMEAATEALSASATASAQAAERDGGLARILLIAVLAFAAVVAALLSFVASKGLVAPLLKLTQTLQRLTAGDLNVDVPASNRKDELGALAKAVEAFKMACIERTRLESDAAAHREEARKQQEAADAARLKAEADARAREDQDRAREIARRDDMERATREAADNAREEARRSQVEADRVRAESEAVLKRAADDQSRVVAALAQGLSALARGDLTRNFTDDAPPEYEKLKRDFNSALVNLRGAIGEGADNVSMLQSGASEISAAADDLSRRTEQQAASLEQTSAALEEITVTVSRAADGARSATKIVSATRANAQESGSVVQRAISAMGQIEQSAEKISQIIGVIDEIAFQTNLLALNAGVEAARAGDAGRGFAVVASEVRALAQRSADAAKEIKALIQTSSDQVSAGVQLVDLTGKSLMRIVDQVVQIDQVVTEISASAEEQSVSLREVNTAIAQMDQSTQQNAAMVEETTAASHSLARETQSLASLVQRFQLGNEAAVSGAQRKRA